VRQHDRLGRAVVRCGEQFDQFERAPAVRLRAAVTAAGMGWGME